MKQKYSIFTVFIFVLSLFYSGITQAQWIIENSSVKENITDVVMLDSVKAIAIGDRNGILRTTDAGSSWINETIMLSAIYHWNAISFCDSLNGIIVGDYTVWRTTDGGINWYYRNVPSSHKKLSVLQFNPGNIYVGDDSGYVHHSIDSGKTWNSEKISDLPVRSIYPFKADSEIFGHYEMLIFALTSNSLFVKNLNDTSSWKNWGALGYFYGLGSEAFKGGFSEGGTEFIVGVEGDLVSQSAIIRLRPPDSHWYSVSPASEMGELRGLSIPSANIIYTCGYNGKILKSTNGGDSWISIETPTSQMLNSIYFFNNERGFAVGDSGTILYTENGGITNEEDFYFPLDIGDLWQYGVVYIEDPNPVTSFVGYDNVKAEKDTLMPNGKSYVLLKSDQGYILNAWYLRKNGFQVYQYSPADSTEYLLYDFSKDIGDTIGSGIIQDIYFENVFGSVKRTFKMYRAGIWSSSIADSIGIINMATGISYDMGLTGAVINGKIYGTIVDVKESLRALPNVFSLSHNYPNPFNPTTTIKYELPEGINVQLVIYNILGEKVAELVNSFQKAGIYKVVWNAKDFASGVYIYKIKAGKFISSKKLILLK